MTIRIREGRIQVSVPGLAFVGEEYNLPEEYFEAGSIGRVDSIVSQGGGVTTVRMRLVRGRPLGRAQRQAALQRLNEQPVGSESERPPIDPALAKALSEKPRDRFQAGGDRVVQQGGAPDIPLPPTPVSGPDNTPVVNSPVDQPQQPSLIIQPGQPQQQAAQPAQAMFHPVLQSVMTPVQDVNAEVFDPRAAAQKGANMAGIFLAGQNAEGPGLAGGWRRSQYQDRIDAGHYGRMVRSVDADGNELIGYERSGPLPSRGSALPRTTVRDPKGES